MPKLELTASVFLVICVLISGSSSETAHGGKNKTGNNTEHDREPKRYKVVALNIEHTKDQLIIASWLMLACVAKLIFHLSKKFASAVPDSTLMIVVGLVVGGILYALHEEQQAYHLSHQVFFYFLLPPIVFDAGYFMPREPFFNNLGSILVYAVIGTLWNTFSIGLSLWGCQEAWVGSAGAEGVGLLHLFLFSSIISAVDPVAVLVVFEEIHVNQVLFILVFGESLLNDAVTVVLYHMFREFVEIRAENLLVRDVICGVISFFVVAIGGICIGLFYALLVAFTTKWTKHVRVLEPLFVLVMAYLSYMTAETFELSGILAIVFCGMAMREYVEANCTLKSQTTIKYSLKMLSSSSETVIFMFLGLSTISEHLRFNWPFIGLTILLCIIYRTIGVIVQTYVLNKKRMKKVSRVDQFIMAYGGLRGAIAYGMAESIPGHGFPAEMKEMFVTTVIVEILFTVFLQGTTIKHMVNCLNVKRNTQEKPDINQEIFDHISKHTTAALDIITGRKFTARSLAEKFEHYNTLYLKRVLMRDPPQRPDEDILKVYQKLERKQAMDMVRECSFQGTSMLTLHQLHTSASKVSLNTLTASPTRVDSSLHLSKMDRHGIFTSGGYGNASFTVGPYDPASPPSTPSATNGHHRGHIGLEYNNGNGAHHRGMPQVPTMPILSEDEEQETNVDDVPDDVDDKPVTFSLGHEESDPSLSSNSKISSPPTTPIEKSIIPVIVIETADQLQHTNSSSKSMVEFEIEGKNNKQ